MDNKDLDKDIIEEFDGSEFSSLFDQEELPAKEMQEEQKMESEERGRSGEQGCRSGNLFGKNEQGNEQQESYGQPSESDKSLSGKMSFLEWIQMIIKILNKRILLFDDMGGDRVSNNRVSVQVPIGDEPSRAEDSVISNSSDKKPITVELTNDGWCVKDGGKQGGIFTTVMEDTKIDSAGKKTAIPECVNKMDTEGRAVEHPQEHLKHVFDESKDFTGNVKFDNLLQNKNINLNNTGISNSSMSSPAPQVQNSGERGR